MMIRLLSVLMILLPICGLQAQWTQLNDAPFVRHHSNGFGYEGKGIVIGGVNSNNVLSREVWSYNPDDDSWERLNNFPGTARGFAIGDDMNGKYYYGFGTSTTGLLNDVWEYDPVTDAFTQLPSCPCEGRTHPAFVAHNNKLFVGAGGGNFDDLNDFWEFDFDTQVWTQKPNIPGPVRHHPFQFGIDDKIYVGGGHRLNWEAYDITAGTWSAINDFPQGRVAGTQFSYKNKGYTLSGENRFHAALDLDLLFLEYDPTDDSWTVLPPHPRQTRWSPTSFIVDDILYFFGGLSRFETDQNDFSMWKFDMKKVDCLAPYSLSVTGITDEEAGLFWLANDNSIGDTIRWRKVGTTDWNVIADANPVYTLDGLEPCEDYEFLVNTGCQDIASDNSDVFGFSTDGCCQRPELSLETDSNNDVTVEWNNFLAAEDFDLRWREVGAADWMTSTTASTSLEITGLAECTQYEVQIKPNCQIEDLGFGESITFWSFNCGNCMEKDYCEGSKDYTGESVFVEEVAINGVTNVSGNDNGFGNYIMPDGAEILIGSTMELTIKAGYTGNTTPANYTAFIDFNSDGTFSSNERVLYVPNTTGEVTREIDVPTFTDNELSRMRVIVGLQSFPSACLDPANTRGELEDYCINFVTTSSVDEEIADAFEQITISPNPFVDQLNIQYHLLEAAPNAQLEILDVVGKKMYTQKIDLDAGENNLSISPNMEHQGMCIVQITNEDGAVIYSNKIIRLKKS